MAEHPRRRHHRRLDVRLRLRDGRVVVWNHEEGSIEDHTQFANLDVFLWVMLRLAAIEDGKLDKKNVEKDIRSLRQGGANFLLDRA